MAVTRDQFPAGDAGTHQFLAAQNQEATATKYAAQQTQINGTQQAKGTAGVGGVAGAGVSAGATGAMPYGNQGLDMTTRAGMANSEDAYAGAIQPQYNVDPTGRVYQWNPTKQTWDLTTEDTSNNQAKQLAATQKVQQQAELSNAQLAHNSALQALVGQIQAQSTGGYQAPQIPITTSAVGPSQYDLAGENAAYAGAKERTGQAMQSAMAGLRSTLAQRGITGSGIDADMTGRIYESGLSDLAGTDRQLAEQRSGREFSAGQANTDREIGQREFNANQTAQAGQSNQQMQMEKLRQLISVYGGMY